MNTENLLSRITVNPRVMVGKPTIRGMRITVEQILRALAGGVTINDLLQDYPELEQASVASVTRTAFGMPISKKRPAPAR